jgi:hypothetical protein
MLSNLCSHPIVGEICCQGLKNLCIQG